MIGNNSQVLFLLMPTVGVDDGVFLTYQIAKFASSANGLLWGLFFSDIVLTQKKFWNFFLRQNTTIDLYSKIFLKLASFRRML